MWNDIFSVIFKHRVALSLCILSRISITEKGQRGKEEVKTQCPSEDVELKVFESFNLMICFTDLKNALTPGDPPEFYKKERFLAK